MDDLADARDALIRHDWPTAFDLASAQSFVNHPKLEAARADLLADAAWWLGRIEICIEARESAYRQFDTLADQRRAGQCAVWLWEHHLFRNRPAIASGWLRRARRALEHEPACAERAAWLLREAEAAHGAGELERALQLATDVVELGRRLRLPDVEAEALQTCGRVLIDRGDVSDGMRHLDEAMLFAVEGRLGPYSTGKVYCSLISACETVGDFDRAAEWTEATMRWSEQHPFAIFPGICRVHRAVVLKGRGALVEAEREAVRACEELLDSHAANAAAAYAEVGDIRRRLGDLDTAESAFATAQQLCGRPCGGLALVRLAQGRVAIALSIVSGCLDATTNPLARGALLPVMVHVAIAADDLASAQAAADELDVIVTRFGVAPLHAHASAARGRLLLALGETSAATQLLADARDRWLHLDVPYEVATARTLLGQALRELGDEAGAALEFASAVKLFEAIGARLDARLASGVPPHALPAGLTEREAEVLRLIAAGLTNKEIANRLFLSVKTVSRHLSNIFTKIGVTTRSAATAFAFAQGLVDSEQ